MLVPYKLSVQFKIPPIQVVDVKVTELPLPAQIEGELGETTGLDGLRFTVTVAALLESDVQLLIVQATRYIFVAVGLTLINVPTKPPVQFSVPPVHEVAIKDTEPPVQTNAELGKIVGFVGIG
jgi:hypothetical protein